MTEDEKYVREHWEWVHCCDGSYHDYPRGTILTQSAPGGAKDRREWKSWSAAAEFTRTRLEQIREVEYEIEVLRETIEQDEEETSIRPDAIAAEYRILARETEALEALKKGMK